MVPTSHYLWLAGGMIPFIRRYSADCPRHSVLPGGIGGLPWCSNCNALGVREAGALASHGPKALMRLSWLAAQLQMGFRNTWDKRGRFLWRSLRDGAEGERNRWDGSVIPP